MTLAPLAYRLSYRYSDGDQDGSYEHQREEPGNNFDRDLHGLFRAVREGAMGIPAALARCRSTTICAPSVIASMSGIDVGDAASFAPMAAATPISATRVRRSPPQPAPIVVHEARSQSSPPRTKSSIVSPRITLKPMDASPLRMSSMAEATVSERCFDVLVNRTAP